MDSYGAALQWAATMSRVPANLSTSCAMASTNVLFSTPVSVENLAGAAFQFAWSGTSPVGTVKLQGSNDDGRPATGDSYLPTNWDDVAGSSSAVSGSPGTLSLNVANIFYKWVRAVYTNTSGTGTLTGRWAAKGGH